MTAPANILIISDLHLGEDVKPAAEELGSSFAAMGHVEVLERELASFLEHHTQYRRGELPWRLVINGDMVDFLAVWLRSAEVPRATPSLMTLADSSPVPNETKEAKASRASAKAAVRAISRDDEDEAKYGVGSDSDGARKKMVAVAARHEQVFRRLAEFMAAGNELIVILGNHDVEFHWPEVQSLFREIVTASLEGDARTEAAARIQFSPWFYYEEGLIWVEHGHQYDDYCSFDYWLSPDHPEQPTKKRPSIAVSISSAGMRYFGNWMPDLDVHNQEGFTGLDYLRWGIKKGIRSLLRIFWAYCYLCYQLARGWNALTSKALAEARKVVHLKRLRELADSARLSEDTLLAVDALRREPVITNFLKLMQTMMVDRVVLAFLSIVGVVLALVLMSWPLAEITALGIVLFALLAGMWIARSRKLEASPRLVAVARTICEHVRARFVVMGHTHEPVSAPLGEGRHYFNTGTWVAVEKPGPLRAFTHVLVERLNAGEVRAELLRWWSQEKESRPFDPTTPVKAHERVRSASGAAPSASTSGATA